MNEENNNFNDLCDSSQTDENKNTEASGSSENISERFSNIENDIFRNIGENTDILPDEAVQEKQGSAGRIMLVIFTALILAVTAASAIYCIVSDIKNVSKIDNNFNEGKPGVRLDIDHRPVGHDVFADENGKYTVEGLAQTVRPQVVEIYSFKKKDSNEVTGSGSGIIISTDGYIVTNTHVIDNMEKYIVNTYDGKSYDAKIVGRDAKTDISVIKIDTKNLSAAQLGDSDDLVQGEEVVAIGNPAGLTGSITDGIVSGLNRKIRADSTGFEMDCIQTNAAISPGNSGGALVNMYGQVVGITSSKYADFTTEGLGFAITINEARPIIEELISQGYVSGRVRVGISFYSAYANYAATEFKKEYGFDIPEELENALWISDISDDCDISNTELKTKDFIISVDDKTIKDYAGLSDILKGKKGGDTVKAKCARVSKDKKIEYFEIEFELMADTSGDY